MKDAHAAVLITHLRSELAAGRMTVQDLVEHLTRSSHEAAVKEAGGRPITEAILNKHLWSLATTIAQVLQHHAPGQIASA